MADDLVELDEIARVFLEPAGKLLVKGGANSLGEGVVRGVADEQVAEPEAVLARELSLVGLDQALADERGEVRPHLGVVTPEGLHGATMEDLAFDRCVLEHASLGGLELVEACGEECLQRRRDGDCTVAIARDREHLAHEKRVAAGCPGDSCAQVACDPLRNQLGHRLVAKWLEQHRDGPGRAALHELRPSHAKQEERDASREQRHMLDQVAERLLAPVDVVEHDDQRTVLASVLERLAERPRDLLR